jgi:hypothetical protein
MREELLAFACDIPHPAVPATFSQREKAWIATILFVSFTQRESKSC